MGRLRGWLLAMLAAVLLSAVLITACGYKSNYNMGTGTTTAGGPMVEALMPDMAAAGSGQLTLTINGSGFGADSVVFFNSTQVATMYVTGNQLMASIPASAIAMQGMVSVYVRSNGQNSNMVNFMIN